MSDLPPAWGRYGIPGWMRVGLPVLALASWVVIATGSTHTLVPAVYLTVLAAVNVALPPTRIDEAGVRVACRGYPFRRVIRWDDVRAVVVSGEHEAGTSIRLVLTDTSVVALRQVPRDRGQAIADVARTTLTRRITPVAASPAPPPRHPTAAELDRDLAARTARLAAQNQELRAALDNIRRPSFPPTQTCAKAELEPPEALGLTPVPAGTKIKSRLSPS